MSWSTLSTVSQHISWTLIKEEELGWLGSALLVQSFQITALTQEAEAHSGMTNIVIYLTFSVSA